MYEHIVWEQAEKVVVITLNRPQVLNALSRALKGELADALTRIKADAGIRAVVITGAGDRAFSAGQDLTEAKDMSGPEAEEWVREYELQARHGGLPHEGTLTPSGRLRAVASTP
jgi:enoyl-CoA hydratase/carnithine racemase